jgi:ribokinase
MSASLPRICVVGSANIDLTFRAGRLPRPGETLAAHSLVTGYGGKGANQAVMAARMGAAVTMVGRVGRDVFGAGLRDALNSEGIDTTYLSVDSSRSTGAAAIFVDDGARNSILVVGGANAGLGVGDVEAAAAAIQTADVLLCQLEVPVETVGAALRIARAHGVRAIFNPAPAIPLPAEILELCGICVPNETELEQLTGLPVASLPEAEMAARALLPQGVRLPIVTLGDRGVLFLEENAFHHIPAYLVAALDTSGAGDAFIGSLAVFLAEGRPMRDALKMANAAAAVSVTRTGAQASFPRRHELEAFMQHPSEPPGLPRR